MTITNAGGIEFANQFMEALTEGFPENNHRETMKELFADEVSLSWSDGTTGILSTEELMNTLRDGWGGLVDKWIFCKPLISVDTDQSRIVIASQDVFLVTGGLKGESHLVQLNNFKILKLNDDKKIVRWSVVCDSNNEQLVDAVAKVTKKLGKEMPEPKEPTLPITLEEGDAFAAAVLKAFSD
eukprot:18288_1